MSSNGNNTTVKVQAQALNLWYGDNHAIQDITLDLNANQITALIGPSGCGKSTFLRCLNRMNDTFGSARVEGKVIIDGKNIYDEDIDVVAVRKRVGMVFQQPNPFPKSIYENLVYAPLKHQQIKKGEACDELVESSLKAGGPLG